MKNIGEKQKKKVHIIRSNKQYEIYTIFNYLKLFIYQMSVLI